MTFFIKFWQSGWCKSCKSSRNYSESSCVIQRVLASLRKKSASLYNLLASLNK